MTGSFLIGIFIGIIQKSAVPTEWKFFVVTGVLGGFTTFSAFSMEAFQLLREGQIMLAMTYIIASIFIGLILTFAGFSIVN